VPGKNTLKSWHAESPLSLIGETLLITGEKTLGKYTVMRNHVSSKKYLII
jgi:hypothetical protein